MTNAITSKIESANTKTLIEMAELLVSNFEPGADLVFGGVMQALESRMGEVEFISLCQRLEG